MVKRAAVILAGGQARRFQSSQLWQDKALAVLEGKPLLVHAVQNVQDVVDEVIVCANVDSRRELYAQTLKEWGLEAQIVVDQNVGHISGPVVAILTGLKASQADLCFTLPCDMPLMQAAVVDYLFGLAEDVDMVVPMWPNGRLETLITVMHRQTSMDIADALCQLKRARADDLFRGTQKVMFASPVAQIKTLDPELKSFVNINAPQDLTELPTRQTQGTITQNMKVNISNRNLQDLKNLKDAAKLWRTKKAQAANLFSVLAGSFEGEGSFFWAALARETQADALLSLDGLGVEAKVAYGQASEDYRLEAGVHEQNNCKFLSERALGDSLWCGDRAAGKSVKQKGIGKKLFDPRLFLNKP